LRIVSCLKSRAREKNYKMKNFKIFKKYSLIIFYVYLISGVLSNFHFVFRVFFIVKTIFIL
jgi:hypothetical protein